MTEIDIVQVDLADRSYDIVIGDGVLARAGALMRNIVGGDRVIVVTDETVAKLHLDTLALSLGEAEIMFDTIILPPGEQTKDFKHLEFLLDQLLTWGIDRSTTLVA